MLQSNSFQVEHADVALDDIPLLAPKTAGVTLTRTAILGNFPPRQCGLATFTRDIYACLHKALPAARFNVIAMNETGADYDYPAEVTHQISQEDRAAYRRLATELNADGTQVLFVQHEFGIYGGPSGAFLLECLERLEMPIVTTLHTVLETPNDEQRHVMKALIRLSSTLVTMAHKGAEILKRVYGVKDEQIAVIPHGAPSRPLKDTADFKALLKLQGRKTLTTFGLLSPNKGIETVIAALPAVAAACPEVLYLVIGATHPHLVKHEGEAYRDKLKAMARDLGVQDHIRFIDSFVGDNDLIDILQATDVYVTPYLTESQITSGTLSYALALGRPTVSTPYWHAQEALAGGVGTLCPFGDTAAFATAISDLLANDKTRAEMSQRAYQSGLRSRWSAVAQSYVARARDDVQTQVEKPVMPVFSVGERPAWGAIERMSDDCGIFQHGKYGLPDRQHGYCTDDNCRALSLVARQSKVAELTPRQVELAYRYAAFVNHAWNPENGRFRNFMSYGRRWLDDGGSDDCCARTFECLVDTARSDLPDDLRQWAMELGGRVQQVSAAWSSVRSRAVMIKALGNGIGYLGDGASASAMIQTFGRDLHSLFCRHAHRDHIWFEPRLSYDNARLSEGLILAGQALGDDTMRADGLRSLQWLMQRQTAPKNGVRCFAPVPTSHFDSDTGDNPLFDQQPLEVLASIDACLTAWRISGDRSWRQEAMRAYGWFTGRNCLGLNMITEDGGCYDGLTPDGHNRNQGAESILAWPLSWTSLKAEL